MQDRWTKEDRAQRERLERQSPSGARVDICGILNKVAAGDASQARPGFQAYELLKAMQAHGRDVARLNEKHDRLVATGRLGEAGAGGGARLDRLHPDSPMQRAAEVEGPDRIDRRQVMEQQLRSRYW